jgi:hypothetical protein
MGHTLANSVLAHPTKKISNKGIASACRIIVDAVTYPLLVACTRMAAYTTEDSDWSFSDCVRDTITFDGAIGLWAGALPYLMVSAYKELEEVLFRGIKNMYPNLDETDTALIGFIRAGFGAVLTSPFLTMSTIIRCQSKHPSLLPPTSFSNVFINMPWKWNLIALSAVVALGAVNLALISEKHAIEDSDDDKRIANEKRID